MMATASSIDLAEYVGVDVLNKLPEVLYLGEKQDKYVFEGDVSKRGIFGLLSSQRSKPAKLNNFLKSAPIPDK
jgi:hypothetical protein